MGGQCQDKFTKFKINKSDKSVETVFGVLLVLAISYNSLKSRAINYLNGYLNGNLILKLKSCKFMTNKFVTN